MTSPLLQLLKLNLVSPTGQTLLSSFDITLPVNYRIGITGASGCGKTTLLKSILNRSFDYGSEHKEFQLTDKHIGYIPQSSGLLPWFSLEKNFSLVFKKAVKPSYYDSMLSAFDLQSCLKKYPTDLSGGEYQRSLLALSIALNPPLYLADEPLTEVDLKRKWIILDYWSSILNENKASLLLVSHDINTLSYLCDQVIILKGSPAQCETSVEIPRNINNSDLNIYKNKILDIIMQ